MTSPKKDLWCTCHRDAVLPGNIDLRPSYILRFKVVVVQFDFNLFQFFYFFCFLVAYFKFIDFIVLQVVSITFDVLILMYISDRSISSSNSNSITISVITRFIRAGIVVLFVLSLKFVVLMYRQRWHSQHQPYTRIRMREQELKLESERPYLPVMQHSNPGPNKPCYNGNSDTDA